MITQDTVERARLQVRKWFAQRMPVHMRFHDLDHTLSVTRAALDIGRASGLDAAQLRMLEVAALFHDTGYALAHAGHEHKSAELAARFLRTAGATAQDIERVNAMIMATRLAAKPRGLMQQVLRDADQSKAGQADFDEKSERLRDELEHVTGQRPGKVAWLKGNVTYLRSHRFHTPYAAKRFGAQKRLNLQRLLAQTRLPKAEVRRPATVVDPFFDRDLSWLAFNHRVLQEAHDPRVPLLERLKFLAIHSSNLDEFYRVRVASLRSLAKLTKHERTALEVPPDKLVERINREALRQQQLLGELYRVQLLPALARNGIHILRENDLKPKQREFVEKLFRTTVTPLLQTAIVRKENANFVEDRKLFLACTIRHVKKKKVKLILVNVPSEELGRFVVLPGRAGRTDILFLDDVLRIGLPGYFKDHKLIDLHAMKLSRDAELHLDEEFAETVVDKVRRSLRKRRTGMPSRFLYDQRMPAPMQQALRRMLELKANDMVPGGRYHNMSDLMKLPVTGKRTLRDAPLVPVKHPFFDPARGAFTTLRKRDVMLHFPYHDFGLVTGFIARAAQDAQVERIAITLYRVGDKSKVCEALVDAVQRGKQVTVFVEVQARFDERSNLFWGETLEKAGARVIYSHEGLKVHAKLCLITRREDGRAQRYAYLATGNFHERNARLYADTALLTTNSALTREVAEVFTHLEDRRHQPKLDLLMMAPTGLRGGIERAVDNEMANASRGKPARILLKLNSLEDTALVRKLYDASRAGVDVHLIVRGICCLVPGVRRSSDRIKAISIVDRFLEHSRAFVFHNGGNPQVYLSSADWMTRNMDRRVEVAFPILDPALREEVMAMLDLQWNDPVKARIIDASLGNAYQRGNKQMKVSSQLAFHKWLARQARTAATRRRA